MKIRLRSGFSVWLAALAIALAAVTPTHLSAASPGGPGTSVSGTYQGRILTELFRHRQHRARQTQVAALAPAEVAAVRADIGDLAIIEESNGVVIRPNPFDIDGMSLAFTRSGTTYQWVPGPLGFDEAAQRDGTPVSLADDDAETVRLPFAFPFFDGAYQEAFLHSDGNVTFGEPDVSTNARSLSRAISGPPRLAPFFSDLDPSRSGASVSSFLGSDRAVFTWADVPPFSEFGTGPRQSFQLVLHRDGRIEFHYRSASLNDAVVGIMPGELEGEPTAADLSRAGGQSVFGPVGEIFSSLTDLDILAVAQRFYQNHDDNYDFLVLFNNTGLSPGPGVFAFEVNVRNEVLGIGDLLFPDPVFDFGADFGSPRRLSSFLNMGPMTSYPDAPRATIALLGENNTLSVMGQEAGHRFLVYVRFADPATGLLSRSMLGRDQAHWSFFLNSDASVLEGNRIVDSGPGISPRFRTAEAVTRFSDLDQYIMGLRPAEEVPPTFLVTNPTAPFSSSRAPRVGVTFDGDRKDISVDLIIAAEGQRLPHSSVAQKDFNFAFVLLVREGASPSAEDLAKLDRIRTQWEGFFNEAVDQRGAAHTSLTKLLHLSTWPAGGVLQGTTGEATVGIAAPRDTDLEVLLSTDGGGITVPSVVTIPAGATAASFALTGNTPGGTGLSAQANAPGYDTVRSLVQVRDNPSVLSLEIEAGDDQLGGAGAVLPEPVTLRVHDSNRIPYSGVPVVFTASGDGAAEPTRAVSDAQGRVQVAWRLASSGTSNILSAALEGAPGVTVTAQARSVGERPALTAAGIVSAASFNTGLATDNVAVAPGGLLSIFGSSLAIETAQATAFPLPQLLGGTSVNINDIPVPLLFVSPGQINLQAPFDLVGATATVTITTPAGTSDPVTIPIGAVQPGVFFDPATGLGAILNNDDGVPTAVRPARAGDFVQVFATGLGAVEPAVREGVAAAPSPVRVTVVTPVVQIGGVDAEVSFSGLAPFFAGLYQLNVRVPSAAQLPSGLQPLVVVAAGLPSNEVFLEVE